MEKETSLMSFPVSQIRYSDAELNEFKQIIVGKLEKAEEELSELRSSGINQNGVEDTSPTYKNFEDAELVGIKETTARLISSKEKFIESLKLALIRIENKSYGVCKETGNLIPRERLLAVPNTTLCIEAKQKN